jgi:aspartyl-tRNA(Asn)/glutamyl-tRNA(Gln) amidotransferase subunit C
MGKLSRDDVLKLAKLARLELSEGEIAEYSKELSDILSFVEKLQAVETDGLLPTNQVSDLTNVTRTDETVDYGYKTEDLLKNVPKVRDNQIQVKRMIG